MPPVRIGTVDLPDRLERERYFRELSYLELSALFAGPLKPGALAKWTPRSPIASAGETVALDEPSAEATVPGDGEADDAEDEADEHEDDDEADDDDSADEPASVRGAAKLARPAGGRSIGLVAPWVLTQRQVPNATRLWHHDATVGDFRDSAHGRSALAMFREAVTAMTASHVIFRSPALFAPSVANRDRLKQFFAEVATEASVGATRVWVPDGLWEPRAAVAFATELGVVCAIDPLVYDPATPHEVYEDLAAPALYFRIGGLGRAGTIRSEKLEDLAGLVEHYQDQDIDLTIAFASPARWTDARNFKKLLESAG